MDKGKHDIVLGSFRYLLRQELRAGGACCGRSYGFAMPALAGATAERRLLWHRLTAMVLFVRIKSSGKSGGLWISVVSGYWTAEYCPLGCREVSRKQERYGRRPLLCMKMDSKNEITLLEKEKLVLILDWYLEIPLLLTTITMVITCQLRWGVQIPVWAVWLQCSPSDRVADPVVSK